MASDNGGCVRPLGTGFFGLLGLLFIGLKLGGCLDWSWWLILLPLYGPACVWLLVVLACLLVFGAAVVGEMLK